MLQFMFAALGSGIGGKKHMMNMSNRKRIEKRLTARPYLPKSKLRGSKVSFLHRLRATHEMEIRYDDRRAQTPSEVI